MIEIWSNIYTVRQISENLWEHATERNMTIRIYTEFESKSLWMRESNARAWPDDWYQVVTATLSVSFTNPIAALTLS